MNQKRHEIDMTSGPYLRKILLFAMPVILTNVLQLLYNTADIVVIGQFRGKLSLAAVGSTVAFVFLFTQFFIGITNGVTVAVSRFFGAGDDEAMSQSAHTSILFSLYAGIAVLFVGFFGARPFLTALDTPSDIIDKAVLYCRIYFLGAPGFMLYTFGAAIMRAVGDTRRPLLYLSLSGIINVILNVIFVLVFDMDVDGVALATIISQYLSAFLILRCLFKTQASYGIRANKLHIHKDKLAFIIRIGLPAGIQSMLFSISNIVIQQAVNSFDSSVVAGVSASNSVIDYMFACCNGFVQACTSFVAANMGAGKNENVGKVAKMCVLLGAGMTAILSLLCCVIAPQLISIFNGDPDVIGYGAQRIRIIFPAYFTFAVGETLCGAMRGFGSVLKATVATVVGTCGVRVIWVWTAFAALHTLPILHMSYPLSWAATAVAQFVLYRIEKKRIVDA